MLENRERYSNAASGWVQGPAAFTQGNEEAVTEEVGEKTGYGIIHDTLLTSLISMLLT